MNQIQTQQPQGYNFKGFNSMIQRIETQNYLTNILGSRKESFVTNLTALVANSAMLQQCEPATIMYAAINATSMNLSVNPNLGQAYVIPFWNGRKNCYEAQFQIGYKGVVALAIRSGEVTEINVRDVREGEIIDEDFLTGKLKFKAREHREDLPVVGYVAYIELKSGFSKQLYMSMKQLQEHGMKYSKTYANQKTSASSKWNTDFDAMAKKTCLKLLLSRYAPLSIDAMEKALVTDQAVISQKGENIGETEVTYIDNDETIDVVQHDAEQETNDLLAKVTAKSNEAERSAK